MRKKRQDKVLQPQQNHVNLGDRVSNLLATSCLKKIDFAEKIGLDRKTLYLILSRKIKAADSAVMENILKLESEYGIAQANTPVGNFAFPPFNSEDLQMVQRLVGVIKCFPLLSVKYQIGVLKLAIQGVESGDSQISNLKKLIK